MMVRPKKITEFHESSQISEDRSHEINRACVKAFVVCGIAWHVIENPFFVEFLKTGYTPPSKDLLSGKLLSQETAVVNTRVIKELKNAADLTLCSALKEAAKVCDVGGGGLKKWADTRWHTMYDCVDSIMRHKLKRENPVILSTAELTVLRSRAFFDDVRALAFTLRPIKQLIAESESQSCTLSDCFLGLAKLGAAIKKLPNKICWARGTFRNLLMIADEVFMKMGKNNTEQKESMHQMKKYCKREEPFDIKMGATETPCTWWFSIEDSFPKDEDYLVQLALKLFSITPHAAGCERVWSSLGWLYGKRQTRLGLDKIENTVNSL
ncbi:hypothetical protein RclHR1_01430026 [Rhizophagus clarus]|uniref:HAT C-terminal dimerisation domain-containing protein n=1 Tax=Rhizophagus clarus TaxID=94130 RepID=A0A2Z6QCE5_9GLOM|nr:hypothetical protein RclHR1_01430026 [Rhizophagus clarus]